MNKLTAANLVAFINQLDKNLSYNYLNPRNKGLIQVVGVDLPEGPIRIKRWNPSKKQVSSKSKIESISSELIWRIANALHPNQPINFDRVLGASYNTRSVLETLLAYTPQFHFCFPGRIESIRSKSSVKKGHKHLMWTPQNLHDLGIPKEIKTDIVISEVQTLEASYDALIVNQDGGTPLDIKLDRRHAQIQIALYFIGHQLKFRTWIAQNDKGIQYQNKRLGEFDGVITSLRDEKLMSAYEDATKAALLIDCIWFKNGKLMPAVMEIEHSTGVTSGLS